MRAKSYIEEFKLEAIRRSLNADVRWPKLPS